MTMQVFPTTEALEVFVNEGGSVTMKQDDAMGDDPSLIIIPLEHIEAVIKALRAAKREAQD